MTTVRLEPAAPQSRVKHSTTEQLCSLNYETDVLIEIILFAIFDSQFALLSEVC